MKIIKCRISEDEIEKITLQNKKDTKGFKSWLKRGIKQISKLKK